MVKLIELSREQATEARLRLLQVLGLIGAVDPRRIGFREAEAQDGSRTSSKVRTFRFLTTTRARPMRVRKGTWAGSALPESVLHVSEF
jgi:hypothetical protein